MDQATIYHEPITIKLQMHYYVLISQFSQVTRCHVFKQVLSFPPVQAGSMAPIKGFDLHRTNRFNWMFLGFLDEENQFSIARFDGG